MNQTQKQAANALYLLLLSEGFDKQEAIAEAERVVTSYNSPKSVSEKYMKLDDLIKSYGLQNAVNEDIYLKLREKYHEKIVFWKEINNCLTWMRDKGKRKVSTTRIQNWIKKASEINKSKERKTLDKRQDQSKYKKTVDIPYNEMVAQLASKMSF